MFQRLATILTIFAILCLINDRWLQYFHCMPSSRRHHTTIIACGGVEMDALFLVAILVIDKYYKLTTQEK